MLEGSLRDFSLDDLLQMISLGGKTGELHLEGNTPFGKKKGIIYFENGEVKDAETEESRGEVAIVELLNIKEGSFKFVPNDLLHVKRSITKSIPDLVLLATSKLDEWNKVKSRVASVDSVFKMVTDDIPEEIHLSQTDWKVLMLLQKGLTIREAALKLNMTVFDVAKIAYGLAALKIIREIGQKNPETQEVKKKAPPKNFILRLIDRIRGL
ncbi:DUF4388 domain-containing protein [Caldisericum exile]|uniref:PatA-like N-terminal domain-containing protein n=1 Tax=Caldisericum exile (strain DSM 21853 / NBRC 104410 / AZM16c01) TaxID=511051 RepID=A0A7U6GFT5_CALEA|nr:DUF4388 domain-containing protein [Caldisericum exile]BAL81609.1 hypothetical protein CSE_14830 [Caldisericum exile AZM16c01]